MKLPKSSVKKSKSTKGSRTTTNPAGKQHSSKKGGVRRPC